MKSGAEYKSFMSGGIAIALVFLVPAYARFAARVPRNRLVVGITLFFVSHLVFFYLASLADSLPATLGLFFDVLAGVCDVVVVAQFGGLAYGVADEEVGTRLFPLVGIGASV